MGVRRRSIRLALAALALVMLAAGCAVVDVRHLSSDGLGGRNNNTPGAQAARDYLLAYLMAATEGANPAETGAAAYEQHFTQGTNLIGVLPGTDLADEYVMVGAHYDGLGSSCRGTSAADTICNGATDNATGTAVAIDILREIVLNGSPPRRSLIFAFWDREEDGLLGSQAYVQDPLIPLEDIVAYVNLDIQGANLRPSGRNTTFAVGAETGGPLLVDAVADAAAASPLDTRQLSLIFGLGRSDHAVLAGAGVPVVFFTDSTGPCYHTVDDEFEVVDFAKLYAQSGTARRLVVDLANRDDTPTFTTGLPLATYSDAVQVQGALHAVLADLDTFSPPDQAALLQHIATVDAVVDAGEEAFDDGAMISLLGAAANVIDLLTRGPCDGFLADD